MSLACAYAWLGNPTRLSISTKPGATWFMTHILFLTTVVNPELPGIHCGRFYELVSSAPRQTASPKIAFSTGKGLTAGAAWGVQRFPTFGYNLPQTGRADQA